MSSNEKEIVIRNSEKKIMNTKCVKCGILLRNAPGQRKKINTKLEAETFSKILDIVVVTGNILCNKCRMKIYRKNVKENKAMMNISHVQQSQELLKQEEYSHQKCIPSTSLFYSSTEDPSITEIKKSLIQYKSNVLKCHFQKLFHVINTVLFVDLQRIL